MLAMSLMRALALEPILVQSSVNFNLSTALGDVEKLTLTGSGAINGTGNGFANTITGNSGANIIEGKGGADILDGGSGTDTVSYASSASGVTVVLNGGHRNIRNRRRCGGRLDQELRECHRLGPCGYPHRRWFGQLINGGAGADTLTGGGGSDSFVFSSLLDPGNIDTITDYSAPNDTMRLDDAIFSALAAGTLVIAQPSASEALPLTPATASFMTLQRAPFIMTMMALAATRAQQFATLSIGLSLTNNDFFVF